VKILFLLLLLINYLQRVLLLILPQEWCLWKSPLTPLVLRMMELLSWPIGHKDTWRVHRRIIKHNQELFTFLDNPLVEPTNNRAERQLSPNVIMRKITFGNRSALSASNHAVMMSIIQTGILNGIEPLNISLALSVKSLTSFTELLKIRLPWIEKAEAKSRHRNNPVISIVNFWKTYLLLIRLLSQSSFHRTHKQTFYNHF